MLRRWKHLLDYTSIRFGGLGLKTKLVQNDDFCTTYMNIYIYIYIYKINICVYDLDLWGFIGIPKIHGRLERSKDG